MVISAKNRKLASVCGWIGCGIGGLIVFCKIVCYYVLGTVGETPGTVIYVVRILDADILAITIGIPLGVCAWYWGRRGLGAAAVALCVASLAVTFVRIFFGIIMEMIRFL